MTQSKSCKKGKVNCVIWNIYIWLLGGRTERRIERRVAQPEQLNNHDPPTQSPFPQITYTPSLTHSLISALKNFIHFASNMFDFHLISLKGKQNNKLLLKSWGDYLLLFYDFGRMTMESLWKTSQCTLRNFLWKQFREL